MSWRGVVAALERGESFRSRVSMYQHPLAGRPVLWHVVSALLETAPPPAALRVLHRADTPIMLPDMPEYVTFQAVVAGDEARALRAAVTPPGMTMLVDGAAALLTAPSLGRLLRAAQLGVTMIAAEHEHLPGLAVAGEGPALASADDPRHPVGSSRMAPSHEAELLRVVDRHALSDAAIVVRDRLVRRHEARGVSFLLPATTWLDVDVRIGVDTLIYPGVVLEGTTVIGSECVIGPHSRIVESSIGRGVELAGWNYLVRTQVRNQAVIEAFARRGVE